MNARDLSFRAKRIDGEGWAYGDYIHMSDTLGYIDDSLPGNECCYAVHPGTLGMYTGFQDIKAHRVYDGDMLWLAGNRQETREVIYKQGCFYGYNSTKHPHWIPLFEIAKEGNFKILGNIHDKKK